MIRADGVYGYNTDYAIGDYAGCTAIPISPRWFITAKHVEEAPIIHLRAPYWQECEVVRRVTHPTLDLALVCVDADLPAWYSPRREPLVEAEDCVMLGYGLTGDSQGNWVNIRFPTSGTNVVERGGLTGVWSVYQPVEGPLESQFARNDSGGAWLVDDQIVGIANSVSHFWQALYGDQSYGTAIYSALDWIDRNIADLNGDEAISGGDVSAFLRAWYASRGQVQRLWDWLASFYNGQRQI